MTLIELLPRCFSSTFSCNDDNAYEITALDGINKNKHGSVRAPLLVLPTGFKSQ